MKKEYHTDDGNANARFGPRLQCVRGVSEDFVMPSYGGAAAAHSDAVLGASGSLVPCRSRTDYPADSIRVQLVSRFSGQLVSRFSGQLVSRFSGLGTFVRQCVTVFVTTGLEHPLNKARHCLAKIASLEQQKTGYTIIESAWTRW